MAVTVVFVARVPTRKKIVKQFKSNESAKRAVEALGKKYNATFYSPKKKFKKKLKNRKT